MSSKGTYKRKYYLHRRIKTAGYLLQLEHTHKTIAVFPDEVETARENKYVAELQKQYNYGVQILNPMTQ